jgi:hypothetical protein
MGQLTGPEAEPVFPSMISSISPWPGQTQNLRVVPGNQGKTLPDPGRILTIQESKSRESVFLASCMTSFSNVFILPEHIYIDV